jgi:DNA polymerase-1
MRILIVDGTLNFKRNYAAVPTLDAHGNPNGGVYGFLNTLTSFMYKCKPDKIIVCWDGPGGSTKRRKLNPNYKKGRKPAKLNRNFSFEKENEKENLISQRIRLGEYLSDLPIYQVTVEGIEADDTIAFLVKKYPNDQKIIASHDKDFFQLLDPNTVVYKPKQKIYYTRHDLFEEYKVHPYNFALARAIVGDSSDNLAGVSGVGHKTLIKNFPCFSEERRLDIDTIMEEARRFSEESKKNAVKYEKYLKARDVIESNYEIMQLHSPIIGFASINKINESMDKKLRYSATAFRVKLRADGMRKLNENIVSRFRILKVREDSGS